MRHRDDVRCLEYHLVREVRHILCDLAALQRFRHCQIVHDLRARFVHYAHTLLHLRKGGGVEHLMRRLRVGDIDAYIVAVFVYRLDVLRADDLA